LSKAQEAQIETALADHAVLKLIRGPTSTTVSEAAEALDDENRLSEVKSSGSYVSLRSHAKVSASSAVKGEVVEML
jgi:hypothetical protein